MVKIGNIELQGRMTLAPMAGVTDSAFRQICREKGAALVCTEMVSAKALVYQDQKTRSLLYIAPDEHPCAVQIFGSEADVMAEAAPMAAEISGADILDVNMGCPVGKIAKSGDGSALMRDPEKAMRAVENVAFAPFRMELKGLGTFGNIIWAGVRGGEELPELAKALRRALIEDDIPCTDRAFVPHITLVRRGVWPGEALPDVEIPTADAWVDHITLMRSEQGKDGMIYTPVR